MGLNQGHYLHSVWLDEDVVQAAVEPPHVVGVGRLGAGAQERGEGGEQLHAAGLVGPRAAPVRVLLRDPGLRQQLEHTCIDRGTDSAPPHREREMVGGGSVGLPELGLELKSPQKTRGAPGATSLIT